jgi:hypothetical protein
MYIGLSKTVVIQSGRYDAVVTMSAYQRRGREFNPPQKSTKWLRDWQNQNIELRD